MQSVISIYNTALARLGGNQFDRMNTPDDESAVATLCRTLYPHVLELALSHMPWSFARATAELGLKPQAGTGGYEYRYALPGDCLRPVHLSGSADWQGDGQGPPFIIEGQDLLCSQSPAWLNYVRRVTDPAVWPPYFADAVAWGLAAELATALVNDLARQQSYYNQAQATLAQAAAIENNSQQKLRKTSHWLSEHA